MSNTGPIQVGEAIEVWGGEIKTPEELKKEVEDQKELEDEEFTPVILNPDGLVDLL